MLLLTTPWVYCRRSRTGSGWVRWSPEDTSAWNERHPAETERATVWKSSATGKTQTVSQIWSTHWLSTAQQCSKSNVAISAKSHMWAAWPTIKNWRKLKKVRKTLTNWQAWVFGFVCFFFLGSYFLTQTEVWGCFMHNCGAHWGKFITFGYITKICHDLVRYHVACKLLHEEQSFVK